ncbi:GntR family transcriptional regulator [Plastorhodobacter daqingensis]|uniref:GntR family transcriptional regulator n=1 Tax=Plastorhodobacter daqingensis TaxID=1387281 RepID=A0ABW2ULR9_9RHOB
MASEEAATGSSQGSGAYRRLLEEIRWGTLAPGTRLRETELAERFGMSRTPIREAIRQLEADGLVVHLPRQGATIRTLDYPEIMELYEMRVVLEGTAARMAAQAASMIELAELRTLNEELAQTSEAARLYELNRQFHLTLFDAAKNRFLIRAISGLQKTMMILGPTTLIAPDRAAEAVKEHYVILDALEARDGDAAEALMRNHLAGAHRARIRALRQRERPIEDL